MSKNNGMTIVGEIISLPFILFVVVVELGIRLVFVLPVWLYLLLTGKDPMKGANDFLTDLPVTKELMRLFS